MECYVFTELPANPIVAGLLSMREGVHREGYFQAFPALLEFACTQAYTEDTIREYILRLLLDSPQAARYAARLSAGPYLLQDATAIWEALLEPDWDSLCAQYKLLPFPRREAAAPDAPHDHYREWVVSMLEAGSPQKLCSTLIAFFGRYSGSDEAKYTAFQWSGGRLKGVARPDPLTFDDLGGLEYQKKALMDNTRAFVEGRPANDILLVGSSGTGKSSCVKAALNRFDSQGLRLVEVTKQEIASLPRLLQTLREKKCRYVIFIDDLSFERPDEDYLELKVALDGQVETRPEHVLIYATSNRRRLVRETWQDRESGDVHENDTLHEKLSLSERFGIRLYFPVLSQKEYFAIVRMLLERKGVDWSDELGREAANWATQYNGRSGRTAKQFAVDYLARGRN